MYAMVFRHLLAHRSFYLLRGSHHNEERLIQQLLAMQIDVLGKHDPHTPASMNSPAVRCWKLGRSDEASQMHEQVLEKWRHKSLKKIIQRH